MRFNDVDISEDVGEEQVKYRVVSKFGFGKSSKKKNKDGFVSELSALEGVSKVKCKSF